MVRTNNLGINIFNEKYQYVSGDVPLKVPRFLDLDKILLKLLKMEIEEQFYQILKYPCYYGIDIPTSDELIINNYMIIN